MLNLATIERELLKRHALPYRWHTRQNDAFDHLTQRVYRIRRYERLIDWLLQAHEYHPQRDELFDYGLNRWYNYWSAHAIEQRFGQLPNVQRHANKRHHTIDFTLHTIPFDLKTTIFPRAYPHDLVTCRDNPRNLIEWFYEHQSQQRRKHHANRLFLVLVAADGAHWKLKARVGWLGDIIERYVAGFQPTQLHTFRFAPDFVTYADVIWANAASEKALRQP